MTTYSLDFINEFIKNNPDIKNKISLDVLNIIKEITNVVSSPSYNKFPDFANKKIYKNLEYMKRKNANKNELTIAVDLLRTLLNKLTDKSYDKLSGDIDNAIQQILMLESKDEKDEKDENEFQENINQIIFSTFLNSKFNSKLYCKLYIDKLQKYDFIEKELFTYVEKDLPTLYEKIELCNSVKFDEMDRVNKINDKSKAKLIFFCNCANFDIINIRCIHETVLKYLEYLITNIKKEANKSYSEELTELICIALYNIFDAEDTTDMYNDVNNEIYNEIAKITNVKNIYPSLSNKIIIKFKNLTDIIYKDKIQKEQKEKEDEDEDEEDEDYGDD